MRGYDVQGRDSAAADWNDIATGVTYTGAVGFGTLGSTAEFRVRGTDLAGNAEPWSHAGGQASTTFFSWA